MRLIRLLKYDLAREVAAWVEKGIVNRQQAEAICAEYGVPFQDNRSHSFGYYVLLALGYLFIGLAALVLIGENWEEIPRGVRMGSLFLLTLASNLVGLYYYRGAREKAATLWFLLGAMLYGTSIMLIAQIYHIDEHFPNGILWWALGILPFAMLLRSLTLSFLMGALSLIWLIVEAHMGYYPAIFPLFLLVTGWMVLAQKQSNLLFLGLVFGFGLWLEYNLAWFLENPYGLYLTHAENFIAVIGLFIFYYAVAGWLISSRLVKYKDYGTILAVWSLRFGLMVMFILSMEFTWHELFIHEWQQPGLIIGLSIAFVAAAIIFNYLSGRRWWSLGTLSLLYLAMAFLLVFKPQDLAFTETLMQVADNLLLVVSGIYLITRGIRLGISHYFYLGVLTIMVTGFLRYIDLIGDYIGAAVLFIVFAVILLAAARYWRKVQMDREAGA